MKRLHKHDRWRILKPTLTAGLILGETPKLWRVFAFAVLMTATFTHTAPARAETDGARYEFNIEGETLGSALDAIVRQTNAQLVYPQKLADVTGVNPVIGRYTVEKALSVLLEGTGFSGGLTTGGMIFIKPDKAERPYREDQMKNGKLKKGLLASVSLALFGAGEHAAAQENGDSAREQNDVVVVTAQRREQREIDVPVSVTVADGEWIADNNINGLIDLSTRLPSVNIASAPGVTFLNIRGVGSGNNGGFEQAVGTFVDGLYRGRSRAAQAALFDVERVEVLRGPQTTFFGNNVIAGALNITTRKPEFEFGVNASVLYAPTDGEYSTELGLNVPLSDELAIRVAGKLFGMDGYSYNEFLDRDEPRQRDGIGRVSVRWEPSEAWSTNFRVDYGKMNDDLAVETVNCPGDPIYGPTGGTCARYLGAGFPPIGDIDYESRNFGGTFDYEFTELALDNDYDLGFAILTSTTGYFKHDAQNVADGAPLGLPGFFGIETTQVINLAEELEQFSQEIRLTSDTGGFLEYMVGAYYSHENLNSFQHVGLYQAPFGVIIGPPLAPNAHVSLRVRFLQDTDNWSVFSSVTANLTEQLALDIGARYSHVTKDILRDFTVGEGGPIPDDGAFTPYSPAQQAAAAAFFNGDFGNYADPKRVDDRFMPSAKLTYKITPNSMVYFSFTKGFKAGGFAQAPSLVEFDEETVNAYELGYKASLFDGAVYTAITLFRSDYKDLQEATQRLVNGVTFQTIDNAAGSRSQGVELSFNAKLSPNLSLRGDVSYLDAAYVDFPMAPCTVLQGVQIGGNCFQDQSGNERGFAPEFSGGVGLSYAQPIFNDVELRIDPFVYFTSDFYQAATSDPLFEQPGYAKIDLRVGLGPEDRRWELAMVGKNLTDKATASFRNQIAGAPGSMWLNPERPRSLAVQASLQF